MLTPEQQSRLDRKCAAASAAAIVADLIKAHFDRPIPQPDPADALAEIIHQAMNAEEPPDAPIREIASRLS